MDTQQRHALTEVLDELNQRIAKLQQLRRALLEEFGRTTGDSSLLDRLIPKPPSSEMPTAKSGTREQQFIQYLSKHGPTAPGDLRKALKVGWSTVYYLIKKKGSPIQELPDGRLALRNSQRESNGRSLEITV